MEENKMITQTLGYINATTESEQTAHTATDNRRKDKLYYIKQKLVGVVLIALGAASVPVSEGDGTAFVMMLFIGLAVIVTREKVLIGDDNND